MTITVRPNQSMLDVVIQATGSLEAAFQFCRDNSASLSAVPVVGTVYVVSPAAVAAAGAAGLAVTTYLAKNGIVVGTLANAGALMNTDGVQVLENTDGEELMAAG